MGKLSNFFRKFSTDKFPKDSQGRRLNDPKPVNTIKHEQSGSGTSVPRAPPSETSLRAADAALNRIAAQQVKSKSAIQRQVEAESARARQQLQDAEATAAKFATNTIVAETGGALQKVSFWCPSLLDDNLRGTYAEVDASIERALLDESQVDPAGAYTLLVIRSIEASQFPTAVNPNDESAPSLQSLREKRKQNFITIIRNLIEHPEKEAFRRLRMSNKLVSDLLGLKYATEFFEVCGFRQMEQPANLEDGTLMEKYLVFPAAPTDEQLCHLKSMLDLFQSGQSIVPKLCRDTTVLKATGNNFRALTKDELPPEFFFVSRDDLRRVMVEQQKEIDEGGMLLTKAMRERLKVRERRIYRYVLIRVKIPGDVLLQGTFMASETVDDVRTWISSCFVDQSITYRLLAPPGQISSASSGNRPMTAWVPLDDCESTSTLVDLGLAPCAILTLSLDGEAQLGQKTTTIKFLPELEQQMLPLTQ